MLKKVEKQLYCKIFICGLFLVVPEKSLEFNLRKDLL